MRNLFILIALLMMHCVFTQTIKPTKEQIQKIKDIFTPEYVIESSKSISIEKIQDSIIQVRDIQIKELENKIELLKKQHNNTLIDIAKQNATASNSSKEIDSINNELLNSKKTFLSPIHLYAGLDVPKFIFSNTILSAELMYELDKIEIGFRGQLEPESTLDTKKYQLNYFIKLRYRFF